AVAKFFQKGGWFRILQRGCVLARCSNEHFTNLVHVAAIRDTDWQTGTNSGIAILPVGYRRIYEFRVWHNDRDIVVGHNHGTSRADLPNCAQDACYFDTISNRDRSLREND